VICQAKTVYEQLDMGIRFLDIGVKNDKDQLVMYKGNIS